MFSVCMHEFAHAYIALREGDDTAAASGHLTLNPLVQMGPVSLIVLCLIGITWGMVPVNPNRMRHRHSHGLVAFAGPAMNIILWLFGVLGCLAALHFAPAHATLWNTVWILAVLNLLLALFNLLPAYPLDGWTVAAFFFPSLEEASAEFRNGMTVALFALLFVSPLFGYLFAFASKATLSLVTLSARLLGILP